MYCELKASIFCQVKRKLRPTIKISVGVKRKEPNGKFVGIKALTREKMNFPREASYATVCEMVKKKFDIEEEIKVLLLGFQNEIVSETNFSAGKYYDEWRYAGVCRLYLGLDRYLRYMNEHVN